MRARRLLLVSVLVCASGCSPAANGGAAAVRERAPAPPAPRLSWPLDLEALRRELQQRGLLRVADGVAKLAKPCLLLRPRDGERPASPTSRLGGVPDLPRDAQWPEWRGEPQAFLAQIRLDELPADVLPELPRRGLLSFFYDSTQWAFGDKADDLGCARVLFTDDAATCAPRELPPTLPADARFREVLVQADAALSLPDPGDPAAASLQLDDAEDEALGELAIELHWLHAGHQLGGHPQPIQDAAMAATIAALLDGDTARASDWLLLLELESDGAPGFMWGDAGTLYFWIRRDDLAARAFDRVWLVYECH